MLGATEDSEKQEGWRGQEGAGQAGPGFREAVLGASRRSEGAVGWGAWGALSGKFAFADWKQLWALDFAEGQDVRRVGGVRGHPGRFPASRAPPNWSHFSTYSDIQDFQGC